jgi:hypothetical protein
MNADDIHNTSEPEMALALLDAARARLTRNGKPRDFFDGMTPADRARVRRFISAALALLQETEIP